MCVLDINVQFSQRCDLGINKRVKYVFLILTIMSSVLPCTCTETLEIAEMSPIWPIIIIYSFMVIKQLIFSYLLL